MQKSTAYWGSFCLFLILFQNIKATKQNKHLRIDMIFLLRILHIKIKTTYTIKGIFMPHFRITLFCTAIIFLLSSCASPKPATHQTLVNAPLPELIQFNDIKGNESKSYNYKLSPDGKTLAWVGEINAAGGSYPTVFYKDLSTGKVKHLSTYINFFEWMPDSKTLYRVGFFPNETSKLYLINLKTSSRDLAPIFYEKDTIVYMVDTLKQDKDNILIRHNQRDESTFDLYRFNIKTKKSSILFKNDDATINKFVLNHGNKQGEVFAYIKDNQTIFLQKGGKKIFDAGKGGKISQIDYDHINNKLWLIANNNSDKKQLLQIDMNTLQAEVVYANNKVDISFYNLDSNNQPYIVTTYPDYQQVTALDKNFQPMLSQFKTADNVRFNIASSDASQQLFVIAKTTSKGMERYLYNLNDNSSELLTKTTSLTFSEKLAEITPIQFSSRDGLTVNGYLTTPNGVEAKNLPMVLLVHGGPHARDYWGFNEEVQLLANRGYAVLQVNYRGSIGYGKAFSEAGFGQFAKAMHNDLIDGVDWAIKQGIADPDKVAIMGASYGGYATLVGMTKTPEKFACGIDLFGMSDIKLFVDQYPVFWKQYKPVWEQHLGTFTDEDNWQKWIDISPINHVEKIQAPLLVIQGDSDFIVRPAQSKNFVKVAKAAGKDVDYWEMHNVGHSYGNLHNESKLRSKVDNFLNQCLGGRSAG